MCLHALKVSHHPPHRLHEGEPKLKRAIHVRGLDRLKAHLEIGREWAEGLAEDFRYREGDET